MNRARVENSGRLRREYLEKEDDQDTRRNKPQSSPLWGAVSFCGHQLSSLYRISTRRGSWLRFRYLRPASF